MTQKTPKIVGYWLVLGAILVITMVVVGGITRLTQSGLSIVNWKPISGIVPPLNLDEWNAEFNRYKTSPEFIKYNNNFTLDDFKSIFLVGIYPQIDWSPHRIGFFNSIFLVLFY